MAPKTGGVTKALTKLGMKIKKTIPNGDNQTQRHSLDIYCEPTHEGQFTFKTKSLTFKVQGHVNGQNSQTLFGDDAMGTAFINEEFTKQTNVKTYEKYK